MVEDQPTGMGSAGTAAFTSICTNSLFSSSRLWIPSSYRRRNFFTPFTLACNRIRFNNYHHDLNLGTGNCRSRSWIRSFASEAVTCSDVNSSPHVSFSNGYSLHSNPVI